MSDPNSLPSQMVSKSKPVLVLGAIAAAATAATGVTAAIHGLPNWVAPTVAGIGVVATAIIASLTTGQVTPWADVAAKLTPSGKVVAGPAARQPTGSSVVVKTDTVTPMSEPMTDPAAPNA